jgi:hypothetical protein
VKWQTRTFEGRMPKGVGVQVPPRAHRFNLIPAISDLYLSTYDDSRFLRQKRKTLIFFTFLVVTTTKSQKPK